MIKKVCLRPAIVPVIFFLFVVLLLLLWQSSGVFAASTGIPAETRRAELSGRDIPKIMSVLESRRLDKRVLEKAAGKMSDMNDRKLRLMSSLCDRISADTGTPAADLAYSLLTALIVLS